MARKLVLNSVLADLIVMVSHVYDLTQPNKLGLTNFNK